MGAETDCCRQMWLAVNGSNDLDSIRPTFQCVVAEGDTRSHGSMQYGGDGLWRNDGGRDGGREGGRTYWPNLATDSPKEYMHFPKW